MTPVALDLIRGCQRSMSHQPIAVMERRLDRLGVEMTGGAGMGRFLIVVTLPTFLMGGRAHISIIDHAMAGQAFSSPREVGYMREVNGIDSWMVPGNFGDIRAVALFAAVLFRADPIGG